MIDYKSWPTNINIDFRISKINRFILAYMFRLYINLILDYFSLFNLSR